MQNKLFRSRSDFFIMILYAYMDEHVIQRLSPKHDSSLYQLHARPVMTKKIINFLFLSQTAVKRQIIIA